MQYIKKGRLQKKKNQVKEVEEKNEKSDCEFKIQFIIREHEELKKKKKKTRFDLMNMSYNQQNFIYLLQ